MEIHQVSMTKQGTELVVVSAAAKMPGSCMGVYRRVAVVEVEAGTRPAMISERARGVREVLQTWERRHAGRAWRLAHEWAEVGRRTTAYERALQAATAQVDALVLERACQYPTVEVESSRSTREEF